MLALLGALGGAFAGHEIGKQATQQRAQYDVVVRTRDGRAQTLRLDHPPSFSPGDTVRLGALRGEAQPAPL
jgi:outer membrane lipoprotein SlyB